MDKVIFEFLLVKDIGDQYQVVGITYSDVQSIPIGLLPLRATLSTIELCKKALAENKLITISKITAYSEVLPHELVIEAPTDLDRYKQVALNEVRARMHQHILNYTVIDAMDYLDCFVKLCSDGYIITNENREDEYFRIISDSQEVEEPFLKENATAKEEQQYNEARRKYENAQAKLVTLEQYLNYYDNLFEKPRRRIKFFVNVRNNILNAQSKDEVDDQLRIFKSNLKNSCMVNVAE